MRGEARVNFAVPAAAGQYAPEVLYIAQEQSPKALLDAILELRLLVESIPAGAEIEVDLLRAGGDPRSAGDWLGAALSYNAAGLAAKEELAGARARVRAKSGGMAGDAVVNAYWTSY